MTELAGGQCESVTRAKIGRPGPQDGPPARGLAVGHPEEGER